MMFNKVGIVGLGLIGGSIAKALKNRLNIKTIVACNRNDDVLATAYAEGIIDEYAVDITDIFCGCDIVFICTPVSSIFSFAKKLTKYVDKSCIISDVGSTKGSIHNEMKALENDITFIGGHPMTGSEKFRYSASKGHLFENAFYMLVPANNVAQNTLDSFKTLIEGFGALPIIVSPDEHDYIVASISHVPHIVASALCASVKDLDTDKKHMKALAAGGFKDITRIASSSPEMWENICIDNKAQVVKSLDYLESVIKNVKKSIANSDKNAVYEYFNDAKLYRDSFATATPISFVKNYEINIDVLDKPGSIAIIAVLFSSNNINIKNLSIINSREHDSGAMSIAFDSEAQRQKSVDLLKEMNYEVHIKN